MVVTKLNKSNQRITRFIQLKTRALRPSKDKVNKYYLGYTLSPKDFREDPRHVFILYNDDPTIDGHCSCFIFSMYDFLKFLYTHATIGKSQLSTKSFRQENNKVNKLKLTYIPSHNYKDNNPADNEGLSYKKNKESWLYGNQSFNTFLNKNGLDRIGTNSKLNIEKNFNKYRIKIDKYKNALYYSRSTHSKDPKYVDKILNRINNESKNKKYNRFHKNYKKAPKGIKYYIEHNKKWRSDSTKQSGDLWTSSLKYRTDIPKNEGLLTLTVRNNNKFYKNLPKDELKRLQIESFKYAIAAKEKYHVYQDTISSRQIFIGRLVCAHCHKPWNMEERECYYCGAPDYNIYVCSNCKHWAPLTGNTKKCLHCGKKNTLKELRLNPYCPTNEKISKNKYRYAKLNKEAKSKGVFKQSSSLNIRRNHCKYCDCRLNYYYFAEIKIILSTDFKINKHKVNIFTYRKHLQSISTKKQNRHINYIYVHRDHNYKAHSYDVIHNGNFIKYKSMNHLLNGCNKAPGILNSGIDKGIKQTPLTKNDKSYLTQYE